MMTADTKVKILQKYTNTKAALINNVNDKYKKSYKKLRVNLTDPQKIHPQTIFVDSSGLFQLISKSKKPEAVKLWELITKEVLPTLFATGSYSLPAKKTDVDRLNKSFYDDNMLSDYKNKLAIYLAYIGKYKGKHVLKFGKTNDFVKRDLQQHRKMYKKFNVIQIWETLANDLVEEYIKTNFASKGMLTALTKKELGIECKEASKRELVILNEVNDLDYCINMIENVVTDTILPQKNKYKDEIRNLKHQYEILEIKYNAEQKYIKRLEKDNEHLQENIKDLGIKSIKCMK